MMTKEEYAKAAEKFGINPDTLGKKFTLGAAQYEIVGINPRARTLPIEARNLKTGSIKKLSAEYGQIKPQKIQRVYDHSYVGRKFEFCGRIFTIVRIDDMVYTDPVVTIAETGCEHRFGSWIFNKFKLDSDDIKWVNEDENN